MTQQKDEALVEVRPEDRALYLELLTLATDNRRRREEGLPIVNGLDLIARHAAAAREEARREGRNAAIEAAAGVVDERAEACRAAGVAEAIDPVEASILDEHLSEAVTAIANLKDRPNAD